MVESSESKSLPRRLCPVGDCFHGATEAADHGKTVGKKPGEWKAMPYILGNETSTRLATYGLQANFMVYSMRVYHMEQVQAGYVLNIWLGITNSYAIISGCVYFGVQTILATFLSSIYNLDAPEIGIVLYLYVSFARFVPMVGAMLSDGKLGSFKTIVGASFMSLLGPVMLTLSAWVPALHPPSCSSSIYQMHDKCQGPTRPQLAFIAVSLGFLAIGAGGIKPCNVPFGVDQFDQTTEEGQKGIRSFFNWYINSKLYISTGLPRTNGDSVASNKSRRSSVSSRSYKHTALP